MAIFENFYEDLASFDQFSQLMNSEHYVSVPEGWVFYLLDIKNSTVAIKKGKYKDVNYLGAAGISVCENVLKGLTIPFVFGGDGATIILPNSVSSLVEPELLALKNLAKENFSLELRVAKIPVEDVRAAGGDVLVAKYEMTPGKAITLVRGGGADLVDQMAKTDYDKYQVRGAPVFQPSLEGLTCRWAPLPAKKDLILSLIVRPLQEGQVVSEVVSFLNSVFPTGLASANPINIEEGKYRSLWKNVISENRRFKSKLSLRYFLNVLEILFCAVVFNTGLKRLLGNYIQSMRTHSDYRKYDDALRFVLDCTESEYQKICEYLESRKTKGEIFYGTHVSSSALMTCLVEKLTQGDHIHFVDGSDGGYAFAAKQLKEQIQEHTKKFEEKAS